MSKFQGSIQCPSCSKKIAPRKIHEHTSSCAEWKAQYGAPVPYFKYDPFVTHRKPLYEEAAVEGVDFVRCLLCWQYGWDFRFSRLTSHIKNHQITVEEYESQFPSAKVRLEKTTEKRVETTKEKYGVDNVSQSDEVKARMVETYQERYGVDHPSHDPGIRARQIEGVRKKYGVDNPFQAGKIKKRIKEKMLENWGVENPAHSEEIQERKKETIQERYGVDFYLQTEEFQEKFKESSRENWGADHPMQTEQGIKRWEEGNLSKYGVRSALLLPEVQKKAYETNLANHGGIHSQQCPEILEKAKKTWLEKYGVDNPSKAEEVKIRIKQVWEGKYGVPFPPQSLWINQNHAFPNKVEQEADSLSPTRVVYAGDGSYWVRHKGASKARNPDFVFLTQKQLEAYQEGTSLNDLRTSATLEIFGDYWHGPKMTGKSREEHQKEVIDYYARANIRCLVIWESELKKNPKRVSERIHKFFEEWEAKFRLALF